MAGVSVTVGRKRTVDGGITTGSNTVKQHRGWEWKMSEGGYRNKENEKENGNNLFSSRTKILVMQLKKGKKERSSSSSSKHRRRCVPLWMIG